LYSIAKEQAMGCEYVVDPSPSQSGVRCIPGCGRHPHRDQRTPQPRTPELQLRT
jgi:hypothetical protein